MVHIPRRALAMAAGVAVVAGLAACAEQPAAPEITTLKASVLNYMITGNWNPVTSVYINTYFAPQQPVYESIIRLNGENFEFEPLLAEEFVIAEDRHTMDIKLREDVDFTDGTHLDADVAKAALEIGFAGGEGDTYFESIDATVEVTGEYEIQVTSTAAMNSDFLFSFAVLPIVSPTAVANDPAGLETMPVGTGPYLLEEQIPEVSVTFVRNPDYRAPENFPFDEIEFLVYEDSIAASNAIKSGQINVAQLDPSLAADAESNGLTVTAGGGSVVLLTWNDPAGEIVPALADERVRQAIALSFDREAIRDALNFGYGTITSQAWGEGSPYYVEGGDDRYSYDPEEARRLMSEAGYADGFAMTIPSTGIYAKYEPVLTQAFADLGITLTFDQYQDLVALATAGTSQYGMVITASSDLFVSAAVLGTAFPQLAEQTEAINDGTLDEVEIAQREVGEIVLDEALVIAVTRSLDTWASIPEISVGVGILTGWPPLLESYRLVD